MGLSADRPICYEAPHDSTRVIRCRSRVGRSAN